MFIDLAIIRHIIGVVGSSPTRGELFSIWENFVYFKSKSSVVENKWCLPCIDGISYVNLHKQNVHLHDEVIKWKHFPRYWPFVRWIHWSLVVSCHKGQWREALMFSLICAWTNGWANNRDGVIMTLLECWPRACLSVCQATGMSVCLSCSLVKFY